MLVHYKKIVPDHINLLPPVKDKKGYKSVIVYTQDSEDLVIQTPNVSIVADYKTNKMNLSFSMLKKGEFLTFLEELQEKIVNIIFKKSETFFNGKEFSENKIRNSLKPIYTLSNEGVVNVDNILFLNDVKVDDIITTTEDINGGSFIAILKLDCVSFIKAEIITSIRLIRLKKCMTKTVFNECILDE